MEAAGVAATPAPPAHPSPVRRAARPPSAPHRARPTRTRWRAAKRVPVPAYRGQRVGSPTRSTVPTRHARRPVRPEPSAPVSVGMAAAARPAAQAWDTRPLARAWDTRARRGAWDTRPPVRAADTGRAPAATHQARAAAATAHRARAAATGLPGPAATALEPPARVRRGPTVPGAAAADRPTVDTTRGQGRSPGQAQRVCPGPAQRGPTQPGPALQSESTGPARSGWVSAGPG